MTWLRLIFVAVSVAKMVMVFLPFFSLAVICHAVVPIAYRSGPVLTRNFTEATPYSSLASPVTVTLFFVVVLATLPITEIVGTTVSLGLSGAGGDGAGGGGATSSIAANLRIRLLKASGTHKLPVVSTNGL